MNQPPRGLHMNALVATEIEAMLHRWQSDFNRLENIHPGNLTENERLAQAEVAKSLQAAMGALDIMLKTNRNKKTTDWR